MEILTSCNIASISPYNPTSGNPWDVAKAKHVFRRLANGTTDAEINIALAGTPSQLIDNLVSEAVNMPNSPAPPWGYWSFSDYTDYALEVDEQRLSWYQQAEVDIRTKGLKGKLTFFWLNHFVTELETYEHPPYLFQYWDDLQTHALGNFRDFVRAIGLNPAMLFYLNGWENTNVTPNENYARELYELFTLGENNGYTQTDIVETSRALTGYNHWADFGAAITFDSSTFDNSQKTIFGQTGNWDYNDVIDILFAEKADLIAPFICEKLYAFFVSPDINTSIVNTMAATLLANDFDMAPVMTELFKSQHFYDVDANGLIIKSPYDLTSIYLNETQFQYDNTNNDYTNLIIYLNATLGQDIFEPVDVAGWQRDRDWINTSTISGRWLSMEYLTWPMWNFDNDQFRQFAKNLTSDSNDPAFIAQTVVDFFVSKTLYTVTDYDNATDILKWEVPQNYYDTGQWNLDWDSAAYQVLLLIQHIFRMPEFQLK